MRSKFVLLITAAWSAVGFFKIHQFNDPTGGDGYFYLKQLQWLGDHYSYYHRDYSFIFIPMAIIYKLTGQELFPYQLMTSLSYFLILSVVALLFYRVLIKIINKKYWQMILVFCFVILVGLQVPLLKLCFQFVKNGLAVAFLLLAIFFQLEKRNRLSILCWVLAGLTHKVLALLGLGYLLVQAASLVFRSEKRDRSLSVIMSALIGGAVVAIIAVPFVFPSLTKHLSHFISRVSLGSFFIFSENNLISNTVITLTLMWLIVGVVLHHKSHRAMGVCLTIFGLIPFLPLFSGDNIEIKNRLFLMSFVMALFMLLVSLSQRVNQEVLFLKGQRQHCLACGLLILSGLILLASIQQDRHTLFKEFPWVQEWSRKIENLDQLTAMVSPNEEVVTHHGLQFYIDFKTPIRARSLIAENRQPQYQIAYVPPFYHLNPSLSDELKQIEILNLGPNYGLFEFKEFQQLMRLYPILAHWRNQFQIRPNFVSDY